MSVQPTRREILGNAGLATVILAGLSTRRMGYPLSHLNEPTRQADGFFNVRDFGALGDGSTDDSQAIEAASAAAESGGFVLIPPSTATYRVARDLRVPRTVSVFFVPGGSISVDAGVSVTLAGPLLAGPSLIAQGDGDLVLERPADVLPEWFGATDDGTTDTGAPTRRAVRAAAPRSVIWLGGSRYLFKSGVELPADKALSIAGARAGTTLIMDRNFGADQRLFAFVGSSEMRTTNQVIRNIRIEGERNRADGVSISADYATNLLIEDVQVYGVANTALQIRRSWDVKLDRVRIFACGGGPDGSPAVYMGQRTSAGLDNVNAVNANLLTVERSHGIAVMLENLSNVSFANCKFHGRAITDANASDSRELLYLRNARLVRVAGGCEFSQARTNLNTGAVRVTGTRSTLLVTGATFNQIGVDDTYSIFFDCSDPLSRLLVEGVLFNDARVRTSYIHIAAGITPEAVRLGTAAAVSPDFGLPR